MAVTFTQDQVEAAEALGLAPYRRYIEREAAEFLGLASLELRRLRATASIGHLKVGRRVFYLGCHLAEWRQTRLADSGPPEAGQGGAAPDGVAGTEDAETADQVTLEAAWSEAGPGGVPTDASRVGITPANENSPGESGAAVTDDQTSAADRLAASAG